MQIGKRGESDVASVRRVVGPVARAALARVARPAAVTIASSTRRDLIEVQTLRGDWVNIFRRDAKEKNDYNKDQCGNDGIVFPFYTLKSNSENC